MSSLTEALGPSSIPPLRSPGENPISDDVEMKPAPVDATVVPKDENNVEMDDLFGNDDNLETKDEPEDLKPEG